MIRSAEETGSERRADGHTVGSHCTELLNVISNPLRFKCVVACNKQ